MKTRLPVHGITALVVGIAGLDHEQTNTFATFAESPHVLTIGKMLVNHAPLRR